MNPSGHENKSMQPHSHGTQEIRTYINNVIGKHLYLLLFPRQKSKIGNQPTHFLVDHEEHRHDKLRCRGRRIKV